MTPAIASVLGGGIVAAYVPALRNQIRNGDIGVPFGTINPIRVRRDQYPLAFRITAAALCGFVASLLVVCVAILIRSIVG